MGKMDCENNKGEQHRYYPFIMRAVTVYDDWAESLRGRIWVRLTRRRGGEFLSIFGENLLAVCSIRFHSRTG